MALLVEHILHMRGPVFKPWYHVLPIHKVGVALHNSQYYKEKEKIRKNIINISA